MSEESKAQSLVSEARELLGNAAHGPLTMIRYEHGGGRLMREEPRDLIADFYDAANRELYFRAPELLSELCDELDQQVSLNQTQRDSITACHEQMKLMREAIEAAIKVLHFEFPGSIKRKAAIAQLERSITPKGEQS